MLWTSNCNWIYSRLLALFIYVCVSTFVRTNLKNNATKYIWLLNETGKQANKFKGKFKLMEPQWASEDDAEFNGNNAKWTNRYWMRRSIVSLSHTHAQNNKFICKRLRDVYECTWYTHTDDDEEKTSRRSTCEIKERRWKTKKWVNVTSWTAYQLQYHTTSDSIKFRCIS